LVIAAERSNPATLGQLDTGPVLLTGLFTSAMARTAGFNSIDMAAVTAETLFASARRRVPDSNQRQALAIVLLSIALVVTSTFALLGLTDHGLERVLFESVSTVSTVGLTTGITADLPLAAHLLLVG
jgi:Trk-type K+ transport system membrane component